jgi:hypothetical protein
MRSWLRSLIVAVILGSVFIGGWWARAQAPQISAPPISPRPQAAQVVPPQPRPAPTIISGNDIGFQVDAQRSRFTGQLYGKWVVRVNGEWVEPTTTAAHSLTMK